MFEGFALRTVDVAEDVRVRVRVGGEGPPVVLLHGHPRTHTTWHRVAPLLVAAGHTVICPDLRGYGRSTAPPAEPDHAQASKRAMAGDVLTLMGQLGHDRFAVAGHDRGSYVAFRLAMDHPDAVSHLAVLDSVPIGEALARADARFAAGLVALVLPRPTEAPRAGDRCRPGRLVRRRPRSSRGHGRGQLRGLPLRDSRPRGADSDDRGLPRRARGGPCG